MYKDYLKGFLDIHKVCEAQICRWKKIMPHSRGEIVTQISTFTSQRYKVLWGLAKSDKIILPREVSFDSPPDIYTLPEHKSWGHPKGWWNPQAGLLKQKSKILDPNLMHPRWPRKTTRGGKMSGDLGLKRRFVLFWLTLRLSDLDFEDTHD